MCTWWNEKVGCIFTREISLTILQLGVIKFYYKNTLLTNDCETYFPTWVINWENKFQSEDKTRSAKVRFQWCSCLLWTFEHYAWAFNLNYHPIGNLGFKPCHFAVVVVERQTKGRVLDLQTRLGPHALDLLYYPLNDY